ncbi:MAG TPA: AAA family ATPase, partial [Parachlamydiaceae bacterium]|nr:AAA family ATPase [Parachlamydiaceae bacterium]
MRLKHLEILGFKSFADKTKLGFHSGITAVVGPNGCGKSNISDAFRWVLGEPSAKSMRGGKMQDVIFAGTTHRKPLNFAEVTITLADINGKLPIEYDEVAVTRRLHRNGESEYFINKHLVRLKDLHALFLDSGMGKNSYSIFEQGKIDQVINLSPLERRYIFEEAAGILRFLQRKKEALRKLEQTDLNVSRVKDIHKEVERQIIVLEEQSEKARQYKENKNILDKLEKCLIITKLDALQVKLIDAKTNSGVQDNQILASNAQIETFQGQLVDAKQALDEAEKALKIRGENVFKVRSHKELQTKEKQTNHERLKEIAAKEKRWQGELESMAERRRHREDERKGHLRAQKETEKQFAELDAVVKVQREKVRVLEEKLMKEREQQQSKQKELFKFMQTESQCESEIRQTNVRLESAQERHDRLYERKERLSEAAAEIIKQADDKKKQLDEAVVQTEKQKDIFLAMEETLQEVAVEMNKTQDEMDRAQQEMSDFKARQKALQHLREEMEGFSTGSKKLLTEAADEKSPLFSKIKGLYEYLVPEKGAEAALAAVMKPYGQTLVVETEADFHLVADYIKKNNVKDISLICCDAISKSKSSKSSADKENLSPLSMAVIENELSLHFLEGVYVGKKALSTFETVKTNAGMEIWLKDGSFIDRRSVIFYSSQGENNIFLREAELKALDKKLQELEVEKIKLENVLKAIQQKRDQIQNERSELDKSIRKGEMKLIELNFSVNKAASDLDKMRAEDKVLATDWQAVKSSMETLTISLNEFNERHKSAREIAAEAQKQTEQLTADLVKLVEAVKADTAELQKTESALKTVVDEQRKQAHALHVLEVQDVESVQQEQRLEEEIEMGQSLQGQIEQKGTETEKVLKEVEHALTDAIAACNELEQEVAMRKKALDHLEAKINEKRQVLKKHETDRNQYGIQSAQLESNSQSLENELRERHQMSIAEARTLTASMEYSMDQMEKHMRQLRQMLENAGDINMTSID